MRKTNSQRIIIHIILTCIVMVSMMVSPAFASSVQVGKKIKNFTVQTTTGETFDLYKTLEEKSAVLIELWFIDCIPCINSFNRIEESLAPYADQIAVVAVNVQDKMEDIADYAEIRGYSNMIFAKDKGLQNAFRVNTFPYSVLVGKGGIVLMEEQSAQDFADYFELAVNLTEQDYAGISAWSKKRKQEPLAKYLLSYYNCHSNNQPLTKDFRYNWLTQQCTYDVYAAERKLSFSVEGNNLHKIVVDENFEILKRCRKLTQFYLVPEDTPLSVRVQLGNGMKAEDATFDGLTFDKAVNDGTAYIFDSTARDLREIMIRPSYDSVKDGYSGYITFADEKSAEWFFRTMELDTGYHIRWHIE